MYQAGLGLEGNKQLTAGLTHTHEFPGTPDLVCLPSLLRACGFSVGTWVGQRLLEGQRTGKGSGSRVRRALTLKKESTEKELLRSTWVHARRPEMAI